MWRVIKKEPNARHRVRQVEKQEESNTTLSKKLTNWLNKHIRIEGDAKNTRSKTRLRNRRENAEELAKREGLKKGREDQQGTGSERWEKNTKTGSFYQIMTHERKNLQNKTGSDWNNNQTRTYRSSPLTLGKKAKSWTAPLRFSSTVT